MVIVGWDALLFRYFMTKQDLMPVHHAVLEVEQLTIEFLLESLELFYPPQNRLAHIFCKTARANSTCDQMHFTENCEFYDTSFACTLPFVSEASKIKKECSCGHIPSLQDFKDCCSSAICFLICTLLSRLKALDRSSSIPNLVYSYVAMWSSEVYTLWFLHFSMHKNGCFALSFNYTCM